MEVIAARGSVQAEEAAYTTALSVRQLKLNAMGLLVLIEQTLRSEYRKLFDYESSFDVEDVKALDEASSTLAMYGAGGASISLPYWLHQYFQKEKDKSGNNVFLGYPQLEDDLSSKSLPLYPCFVNLLRSTVTLVKALIERGDVYLPQEHRQATGLPIVRSTRSIIVMLRLVLASIRTEHFILYSTSASDDSGRKGREPIDGTIHGYQLSNNEQLHELSQNELEILEQLPARVLSVMLQKNIELGQAGVFASIRILHSEVCSAYYCGRASTTMSAAFAKQGLGMDASWLNHTQTEYLNLILPLLKTMLRNVRHVFNELFSWEMASSFAHDTDSVSFHVG